MPTKPKCDHDYKKEQEHIRHTRTPEEQRRQDKANSIAGNTSTNYPLSATLTKKICKKCGDSINIDYRFN